MFHALDNKKVLIVGEFPSVEDMSGQDQTIRDLPSTQAYVMVDPDRLRNEALVFLAAWMENSELESFEFKGLEIRRKM